MISIIKKIMVTLIKKNLTDFGIYLSRRSSHQIKEQGFIVIEITKDRRQILLRDSASFQDLKNRLG